MFNVRRGRVVLSAAVAAAAAALSVSVLPASPAAADVVPAVFADQVINASGTGSVLLQQNSDATAAFAMTPSTAQPGGVQISTGQVKVELAPASGQTLTTGEDLVASYVLGHGAYFAVTGQASTQLSCQSIAIHVQEVDRDNSDAITGIAASFHETCLSSPTSDWGEIEYGTTAPFGFAVGQVSARQAAFPETASGQTRTQTVTVQNYGTADVALGQPTVSGLGKSAYSIGADNCAGTTLPAGQTCNVDLTFAPPSAGTYSASLSYPTTDQPSGAVVIPSYGTSKNPPAAPSITAYPGDNGIGIAISPGTTSISTSSVTGWAIYRDGSTTPVAQLPVKTLTWADAPIAAGESHSYTVVAQSADGDSAPSNSVTADAGSPQATPGTISAFTVDATSTTGPAISRVDNATLQSVNLGSMTFAGPNGDSLTLESVADGARIAPGTYLDPDAPTVLSNYATACRTTKLVVADADIEADGTPDVLTASYHADCGDETASGEIRWNSTQGYRAAATTPTSLDAGAVVLGQSATPSTVTVTSTGTQSVNLGTATLEGDNSSDFSITNDNCSQQPLAPGDSCQLNVGFAPSASGPRTANLRIPDDTASGGRLLRLSGSGETVPGAPVGATGTPGSGFIRLDWSPPGDDGGATITSYRIYRGPDVQGIGAQPIATVPATADSWSDDSVVAGASYVYAVTAVNAVGEGPALDTGSVTPLSTEMVHSEDLHGFGNESLVISNTEGGGSTVLVDDGHQNIEPAISPDGKTVAYVSNATGTDEIWTVPADGSGSPRQVTDDPQADTWPAWSRDGTRIAYTTLQGAVPYTATIGPDGLYENVISGSDHTERPSWTPSDRELVVGSTKGSLGADVLDVQGNGRRHVAGSDGGQLPQVSPDGRSILSVVYDSDQTDSCGDGYQLTHLETVPYIGGTATTVGPTGYDELDPTWWPDGKAVAYDRPVVRNGCLDNDVIETRDVATGNMLDATNSGEFDDYPALHAATASPVQPASAPLSVKAQLGTSNVMLHWVNPTDAHFWQIVVRRSTAGGSAPTTPDAGTPVYAGTGTSATVNGLEAGKTYQFSVFAIDDAGTSSRPGGSAVSVPYDDRWSGLHYSGRWKSVSAKAAWLGTLHEATATGASMTASTTARQLTLIGQSCKGCGAATIYIDGVKAARISTAASRTTAGKVLWQSRRYANPARHTIRLVTAGKAPVWVDALGAG